MSARRARLLVPTLMAAGAFAVLLGLGFWQLQRLEWKTGLIAARRAALAAPPAAAPAQFDPARDDGRRVRLEGRFLHEREMYLGPRAWKGRPGYRVITPLILAGGGAVLVDRGWVPMDRKAAETRAAGQVRGSVAVEGLMRAPARPGPFTPENEPEANQWFTMDVDAMARWAGLARARPYWVQAGPAPNPGGLPVGKAYAVDLPNNHLQYALTWFALAAALAVIYGLYMRGALGRGRPSDDGAHLRSPSP